MLDRLRRLTESALDLLYPPRCVNCSAAGAYLCADCLAAVRRFSPPICPRCGHPLAQFGTCPDCCDVAPHLDGIRSAAYFDGPLREAIHQFKYENLTALSPILGRLLADAWSLFRPPTTLIVPVPLHAARFRERGYNQSEVLARELGRAIDLPVAANAIRRVRETRQQTALSGEERRANVREAFEIGTGKIRGEAVLLIDDVCTTGATLRACAAALEPAGPVSIWALTLARAR